MNMEEIWQRIDLWLSENQPDLLHSLNPAATSDQLSALERALSAQLPEHFHRSAMVHNGQIEAEAGLIDGWEILSLNRIEQEWMIWKELLDDGEFDGYESEPALGIKQDWWNARWIPIAADAEGNSLCLDLDPAPGGTSGQVITMWHDSSERNIVARSFAEWLEEFASGLESGKITYHQDGQGWEWLPESVADYMVKELRQKYLNERREFFLEAGRIRLVTKDIDGEFETYIRYENLTDQRRSYKKQDGRLYISAISFGIFGLIGLVANLIGFDGLMRWAPLWLVASLIFFGFYFYKRRYYLLIDQEDRSSIFFLHNKPSKEKLEQFLAEMFIAQKHYLRNHYLYVSQGSTAEEEISKLRWLLHKNAISEAEFEHGLNLVQEMYSPQA